MQSRTDLYLNEYILNSVILYLVSYAELVQTHWYNALQILPAALGLLMRLGTGAVVEGYQAKVGKVWTFRILLLHRIFLSGKVNLKRLSSILQNSVAICGL